MNETIMANKQLIQRSIQHLMDADNPLICVLFISV